MENRDRPLGGSAATDNVGRHIALTGPSEVIEPCGQELVQRETILSEYEELNAEPIAFVEERCVVSDVADTLIVRGDLLFDLVQGAG